MATSGDRRVGSAERETAASLLSEHFAAGHLGIEEFNTRLDAAFAATGTPDLAQVTAGLPPLGPGRGRSMGLATGAAGRYRRRHRSRARFWLLTVPLLGMLAGAAGVGLLLAVLLPHTWWVLAGLLLLSVPVVAFCCLIAAAAWIVRRAWRRAVWLEALPLAAGAPWMSRLIWLARAILAGRALHRASRRARMAGTWRTGYSYPGARWS
jgi:Domain of unknown function (DUF1707)